MRLLKQESIEKKHLVPLGIDEGVVREVDEIKNFGKLLGRDQGLYGWWRVGMGYVKEDD